MLAGDGPLLILAGPGSGKTTVLAARIAHLVLARQVGPASILALTFTAAAARTLRARLVSLLGPPGQAVDSTTFHAFGLRVVRQWAFELGYAHGPLAVYGPREALALLREAARSLDADGAATLLSRELAGAMERYRLRGQPDDGSGGAGPTRALPHLAEAYEALLRRRGALDYPAMLALPLRLFREQPRALRLYQTAYRHVLGDEFQDVSAAQFALLRLLADGHRNLVVVGDPLQCMPPETRVQTSHGRVPIGDIRVGDSVLGGAGRGTTAVGRVSEVLRKSYDGDLIRIGTRSGRVLRLTPNHMCFARLGLPVGLHYVYLMHRRDLGFRIGVAISSRPARPPSVRVSGLLGRAGREGADRVWLLRVCPSRAEASFYEQLWSVQYGIPTTIFRAAGALQVMDQEAVDRLFALIDTRTNARRLLADLGLHERYPHHRAQAWATRDHAPRLLVHMAMFGGNEGSLRSPWAWHRVWLNSSDPTTRQELERRGLVTRAGRRDTWRVERHVRRLPAATGLAEQLADAAGVEVVQWAMLTGGPRFALQPASNLRPSMIVPVVENGRVIEDEIILVDREHYCGPVYDLNVEHLHNYVAEGVVVHNCLYGFRGADVRFLLDFRAAFPDARVLDLAQNFRSTGRIVALANALGAPLGYRGPLWTENAAGEPARVHVAADERAEAAFVAAELARLHTAGELGALGEAAILYRTNRQAQELCLALRAQRLPYRVRGDGDLFARREVRDAVAYLRLAHNPSDGVALARIVNVPPRRLGRLAEVLGRRPAPVDALVSLARRLGVGPASLANAERLAETIGHLHAASAALAPAALLDTALEQTGYRAWLEAQADGAPRLAHLDALRAIAARTTAAVELGAWLADLALGEELAGSADDERASVLLTTIHQAKGGEWRTVFVVGVEEGLLPHARSLAAADGDHLDEERRVAYVAVTRPRERLYLTYCRARRHRDEGESPEPRRPSRFLRELPGDLLARAA